MLQTLTHTAIIPSHRVIWKPGKEEGISLPMTDLSEGEMLEASRGEAIGNVGLNAKITVQFIITTFRYN